MAIELSDDGTLDTVLRCDECGEEFRFTYAADTLDPPADEDDERMYAAWIEDCITEVEAEHRCDPEMDGLE